MEPNTEIMVSVNVVCKDPHAVTRVSEILARAGTGLALEGLMVNIVSITKFEQEGVGDQS